MANKEYQVWVDQNCKKFPTDQKTYLLKKFGDLNEEGFLMCKGLGFKDPTVVTIVSVTLGWLGVDRFMLGQIGLGLLKLCTLGGGFIWYVVDWFLVGNKTKELNLQLLQQTLMVC